VLAMLFIAATPIVEWFFKEPRLQTIIFAISPSIVFSGLSVVHLALLKRSMEFHKLAANSMIVASVGSVVPIILAWLGWGQWALVAKWLIFPFLTTIGAWLMCSWRPGRQIGKAGVGPLLRFALHTVGNFTVGYFRRNLDKMLLGRFFGTQDLGLYDRAYHLASMLPNQIVSPISSVALSAFSKLSYDPQNYRHNYLKMVSVLAFAGMPLSSVLTIVSNDVVIFILGPQWSEAGSIFFIFSLSIGVSMIYITHGWLHLSLGTADRWFRWGILEFFVTAIIFLIAIKYGALGVAAAYTASFYVLIGPALWYAGKPVELKLSSIFSVIWRYFLSSALSALISWLVLYRNIFIGNDFMQSFIFLRILLSFILNILLYFVLITILYKGITPIEEFISIIRKIFFNRVQTNKK
jgi:PST family polysaccharide transporter